jgi:hypothetical protein
MKRQSDEADVETSALRRRWLDAVDELLRTIRGWLQHAADEGLARVDPAAIHIPDDDVGAHDAPALKITLPGPRVVWVRPVGTLRVGAHGIVDVVCGPNRALLVLNRTGVWKIRGRAAGSPLAPLDQHAFSRVLAELL